MYESGQNKNPCKNNFGFEGTLTLTPPARTKPLRRGEGPALSYRMGEEEWFSVGRRIQPLWKL